MNTRKEFASREVSGGAEAVGREIAKLENKFQEDLNRGFGVLGEGCFKSLRRQLPVTRQRMEWEKFQGYRVSFGIPPFYPFLLSLLFPSLGLYPISGLAVGRVVETDRLVESVLTLIFHSWVRISVAAGRSSSG